MDKPTLLERVMDVVLAAVIGVGLAVLLVEQLAK